MNIREMAIEEMKALNTENIMLVYEIIQSLKGKKELKKNNRNHYLKVREALKNCRGSLSQEIESSREDRL